MISFLTEKGVPSEILELKHFLKFYGPVVVEKSSMNVKLSRRIEPVHRRYTKLFVDNISHISKLGPDVVVDLDIVSEYDVGIKDILLRNGIVRCESYETLYSDEFQFMNPNSLEITDQRR